MKRGKRSTRKKKFFNFMTWTVQVFATDVIERWKDFVSFSQNRQIQFSFQIISKCPSQVCGRHTIRFKMIFNLHLATERKKEERYKRKKERKKRKKKERKKDKEKRERKKERKKERKNKRK